MTLLMPRSRRRRRDHGGVLSPLAARLPRAQGQAEQRHAQALGLPRPGLRRCHVRPGDRDPTDPSSCMPICRACAQLVTLLTAVVYGFAWSANRTRTSIEPRRSLTLRRLDRARDLQRVLRGAYGLSGNIQLTHAARHLPGVRGCSSAIVSDTCRFMSSLNYLGPLRDRASRLTPAGAGYYQHLVSIYALNAFFRSVFAAFGPLYSNPAIRGIGVDWYSTGMSSSHSIALTLRSAGLRFALHVRQPASPTELTVQDPAADPPALQGRRAPRTLEVGASSRADRLG